MGIELFGMLTALIIVAPEIEVTTTVGGVVHTAKAVSLGSASIAFAALMPVGLLFGSAVRRCSALQLPMRA